MKKNNFAVIARTTDEGTRYLVTDNSQIIEKQISETYDQYGQLVGHYYDYCLDNKECTFKTDLELSVKSNFNFRHFELSDGQCNLSEIEKEDIEVDVELDDKTFERVKKYMLGWEQENKLITTCTCFEFWDGHNHKTIVLHNDYEIDFGDEYRLLSEDDEEDKKVLDSLLEAFEDFDPHVENGAEKSETIGEWIFYSSRWSIDPWIAQAEKIN